MIYDLFIFTLIWKLCWWLFVVVSCCYCFTVQPCLFWTL